MCRPWERYAERCRLLRCHVGLGYKPNQCTEIEKTYYSHCLGTVSLLDGRELPNETCLLNKQVLKEKQKQPMLVIQQVCTEQTLCVSCVSIGYFVLQRAKQTS